MIQACRRLAHLPLRGQPPREAGFIDASHLLLSPRGGQDPAQLRVAADIVTGKQWGDGGAFSEQITYLDEEDDRVRGHERAMRPVEERRVAQLERIEYREIGGLERGADDVMTQSTDLGARMRVDGGDVSVECAATTCPDHDFRRVSRADLEIPLRYPRPHEPVDGYSVQGGNTWKALYPWRLERSRLDADPQALLGGRAGRSEGRPSGRGRRRSPASAGREAAFPNRTAEHLRQMVGTRARGTAVREVSGAPQRCVGHPGGSQRTIAQRAIATWHPTEKRSTVHVVPTRSEYAVSRPSGSDAFTPDIRSLLGGSD